MHKQFKKFGFFVSKNLQEEANEKLNDKLVKYLYKKETDKSNRRKIKSANDADTPNARRSSKRYSLEDKHRSQGKKSNESILRKHKKKESLPNTVTSETEIYFISPEEIKRHRKKLHKEGVPDKCPEDKQNRSAYKPGGHDIEPDKRRIQKREDDIVKLIKEQKHTQKSTNDDYQWLTKKEIFKLISNTKDIPKNTSTSSNFLKKFFVFDKQDGIQNKAEFVSTIGGHSKKVHRYSEDNPNIDFLPCKTSIDSTTKKAEKMSRVNEKRDKEDVSTVLPKRHHERSKSKGERIIKEHHSDAEKNYLTTKTINKQKSRHTQKEALVFNDFLKEHHSDAEKNYLTTKRRKSRQTQKEALVFDDLSTMQQKIEKKLSPHKPKENESQENGDLTTHSKTKKNKTRDKTTEQGRSPDSAKAELNRRLQNVSRANPLRHKFCLVKNTFSVVQITPANTTNEVFLEKKKKLKAFKKYYRYNIDGESEISSAYQTFSDSNKMYQDMSEQSMEDTLKKRHRKSRKFTTDQKCNFKVETHISSVVINPDSDKNSIKTSRLGKDEGKANKTNKFGFHKSKIPILSNNGKLVELNKESPRSSRSHKKSNDLFAYSVAGKEADVETASASKCRSKVHNDVKDKIHSRSPTGSGKVRVSSSPASFPNKPTEVPLKAKEKKAARPSTDSRLVQKESKASRLSTLSKQSKLSDKQPIRNINKPSSSNSRNQSLSPSSLGHQKEFIDRSSSRKGIKSPLKLSNDGSSSVWSKSSRKSGKNSFTSKSDTKLQQNNKISLEKKYKTLDRASTRTSLSNSTFGDKSLDSSKNGTSFFLTKSYKDDEKLNRWQKRKLYSDSLRKNMANKVQKASVIPPQVVEIRYLTVTTNDNDVVNSSEARLTISDNKEIVPTALNAYETEQAMSAETENAFSTMKEFYEDDLPCPCMELVNCDQFKELFELPMDKALNEIMNENYNFLKKDFSYAVEELDKSSSSDGDNEFSVTTKKVDDWYDFQIVDGGSLSEISCCRGVSDDINNQELNVRSQDHIVGKHYL